MGDGLFQPTVFLLVAKRLLSVSLILQCLGAELHLLSLRMRVCLYSSSILKRSGLKGFLLHFL